MVKKIICAIIEAAYCFLYYQEIHTTFNSLAKYFDYPTDDTIKLKTTAVIDFQWLGQVIPIMTIILVLLSIFLYHIAFKTPSIPGDAEKI